MATFAFPTLSIYPGSVAFDLISPTRIYPGQYGPGQTSEVPLSSRWGVRVRLDRVGQADRGLVEAWLAQLRGQANRFTLYDFSKPGPLGTLSGSPTVSGISQGATSCTVSGGSGNWKRGDRFNLGVGGPFVIAVADGATGGTLTFEPPARNAVSGGSSLVHSQPSATYMLTEAKWGVEIEPKIWASFAFAGIENWN